MLSQSLIQLPQVRKADFSGYVIEIVAPLLSLATGSGLAVNGLNGQFQFKSGLFLYGSSFGEYGGKIGYGTTNPIYDFHISGKNLRVDGTGFFDSLFLADSHVATEYVLGVTGIYLNNLISNQSSYNLTTFYLKSNPSGYISSSQTGDLIGSGFAESRYYLRSNPSGYITGLDSSTYITTGQTGVFASTAWTDSHYYPRTNPSGYVKSSETGILLNRGETGNFASTGWSYQAFYPLSNPSGYGSATNHTLRTITGNYTAVLGDEIIIFNRTNSITGILPIASGAGKGYIFKNINSGIATITGNGSDTIDGEFSQSLNQWDAFFIIDYAANKWIIV